MMGVRLWGDGVTTQEGLPRDLLIPLPAGLTHSQECAGDRSNSGRAWLFNCPACMYRYGYRRCEQDVNTVKETR